MNHDREQLRHQLEQATAAEQPPGVPLDPQTASLREGWLLLGQLLEAAQPQDPLPLRPPRARQEDPTRRSVPQAVTAVLAASLLVGTTLLWTLTPAGDPRAQSARSIPPKTPADFRWDDPLDQQLAEVAEQLTCVEQQWYSGDDMLASVAYGMEQISQEIKENTL